MYTKRNTKPLRETKNVTYLHKASANKMQQTVEVETALNVFIHFGQRCRQDIARKVLILWIVVVVVAFVLHCMSAERSNRFGNAEKLHFTLFTQTDVDLSLFISSALSNKASPNILKF